MFHMKKMYCLLIHKREEEIISYDVAIIVVNKGNSSISMFETHKSIEKKKQKKQIWVTN